jgi:hypothetical protein
MVESFDYKGYRVVITAYLKPLARLPGMKPNQQVSIVGLDNRVTLFLDNTSFVDARAEIMAHIDQGTLEHLN